MTYNVMAHSEYVSALSLFIWSNTMLTRGPIEEGRWGKNKCKHNAHDLADHSFLELKWCHTITSQCNMTDV